MLPYLFWGNVDLLIRKFSHVADTSRSQEVTQENPIESPSPDLPRLGARFLPSLFSQHFKIKDEMLGTISYLVLMMGKCKTKHTKGLNSSKFQLITLNRLFPQIYTERKMD